MQTASHVHSCSVNHVGSVDSQAALTQHMTDRMYRYFNSELQTVISVQLSDNEVCGF